MFNWFANKHASTTLGIGVALWLALMGYLFLSADNPTTSVARYCEYGAVSQAQINGCMQHVEVARIDKMGTHAALYARYALTDCLADAGPFCTISQPAPDEP